GELPSRDGPGPRLQPHCFLLLGEDVLRIDAEERLGIDGHLREELLRILVDATEPREVRHDLYARRRADRGEVALWQLLDDRDLVDGEEPVLPREVDARLEAVADRHEDAEEQEG